MRSKSPELMEKIKNFAEDYYAEYGVCPSNKTIAEAMGMGRSTAYVYLVEMAKRGMITYENGIISSDKIKKLMRPVNRMALVGSIPCGQPDEREEFVEEYLSLPVSIFGKEDCYVLRASGDSMTNAGIESGDLVVIEKREYAEVGDIVVALTNGNESTLKRLAYDGVRKSYYLHPESPNYADIYVNRLSIQGVARHVIKAL